MEDRLIDISTVCGWYEDSVDATMTERRLAERDRDYYDNKQWTDDEVAKLSQRGQPAIVINRIKPKIDYLLGSERQQRTDPRAAPRTPMDEEAAHAATDAIRYVCDDQDFSTTRSDVFENLTVEGKGGAIVEVKQGKKRMDIIIRQIPWDRMFIDPHSRRRDFSDAKYKGIVAWMDVDDAVALYGEDKRDMLTGFMDADQAETYGDKPSYWIDRARKRVMVCEAYYREGETWLYCVYTKAGFLRDPQPSYYVDEDGTPMCPIEYESCHVDRDNRRYGLVRQLIGPQDEVNKRRSKALHLISQRQVQAERGAVDNVQQAKKELGKPDGWVETNPGYQFQVLDTNDMAQGNLAMLAEAKAEIDAVGANAALTGKDEKALSGRALQARQQGGLVELGPVFDALRNWQKRIYRQVWYRIKQFWTEETWVRVTDDENNVKFVGLNTMAIDPQTGMPQIQNNVTEMDMDIIMEDVPDTVNLQAEQFEVFANLFQADKKGELSIADVLEVSALRNKKALIDRLRPDPNTPQAQQQMAKQQESEEYAKAKAMAELEKIQSETAKNVATAEQTQFETALQKIQAMMEAQAQQQAQMMERAMSGMAERMGEVMMPHVQQLSGVVETAKQQQGQDALSTVAEGIRGSLDGLAAIAERLKPSRTTITLPSGRQAIVE